MPDESLPVELDASHAGELLTLQRACYLTEARAHQDFDLPPLTQTLAELVAELSDPLVTALGIRRQGRLIGSVRLAHEGERVNLGRLIVAPDLQGRGLGTALLQAAESAVPGAREIWLFTGEHSHANIRLYERLGYEEQHRTPVGGYDLVHFRKSLGGPAGPTARAAGRDAQILRDQATADDLDELVAWSRSNVSIDH